MSKATKRPFRTRIKDTICDCVRRACSDDFAALHTEITVKLSQELQACTNTVRDNHDQLLSQLHTQEKMLQTYITQLQQQDHAIALLHSQITDMYEALNDHRATADTRLSLLLSNITQLAGEPAQINRAISLLSQTKATLDCFTSFDQQRGQDIINCINYIQERIDFCLRRQYDIEATLHSMLSYSQNEFVGEHTVKDSADYQYYTKLHSLTKAVMLSDEYSLLRIGRKNDGGYVMTRPFSDCKIAYSIGICDDVSWDLAMVEYGYEIYQYDHTIVQLPVENPHFHWIQEGLGATDEGVIRSLATILSENGHQDTNGMLLKMDIEGCEWGVLSTCSEQLLSQFDQIVIELHNLTSTENRAAILSGLELLNKTHVVTHLHANNYEAVIFCGELVTPNVLEVTYLNRKKVNSTDTYTNIITPIDLDSPNRWDKPDLWLGEW